MVKETTAKWTLFVVLAIVWGSSFVLMKEAAVVLTGWQIAAIRIVSGSLVLLPLGIFNARHIPKEKLPLVVLTGIIGNLIPAFLFAIAIYGKTESSLAGILNSLTPLFVLVLGAVFFKTAIPKQKLQGVLLGLAGLVLLSASGGPVNVNDLGRTALILLATFCYGLNVSIISFYLKGIDPLKTASVSLSFLLLPAGLVLLLNPVQSIGDPAVRKGIVAAVTLGILGSAVATYIFYQLIKTAGGLFASLVTYVIPIVAIVWGLVSKEAIGGLEIVGLGIILSGVYLANR